MPSTATTIAPRWTIHPSQKAIDHARAYLNAKIAAEKAAGVPHFDSTAAVSDPNTTVYLNAMELDGLPAKATASGCLDLQVCSACQRTSVYTLIGADQNQTGDREFQVCANCDMPRLLR